MENQNPWLGLRSYSDPQKSDQTQIFCGRDQAVRSIFTMVNNNLLVTLYGKTGIGKTSLLNAGLFPLLRDYHYLPIAIRLGNVAENNDSLARFIIGSVFDEINNINGHVESQHLNIVDINCSSTDYLWRFFCTTTFFDKEDKEVFPVIVIDQLEEIFLSHAEKAGVLMKQINALIDDNRAIPQEEGYADNTNFRFVLSIREDDLFYLEDCIDTFGLPDMKDNRYRLSPLLDKEATEIILLGEQYLHPEDKEEIVKRIIRKAKDEHGCISTNLLSLVCSELFVQSNGHITLDLVSDDKKDPLVSFYKKCMNKVSDSTRHYIEENFVDNDRRRFISKNEFESDVASDDVAVLTQGESKIIQDITAGNTKCVELIHDSLARTINMLKVDEAAKRKAKQLQKRNKRIKTALYTLTGFLLLAIGTIVYLAAKGKIHNASAVSQIIVMRVSEDTLAALDYVFWKAELQVSGVIGRDTTRLREYNIHKAPQFDTTFTFPSDSFDCFLIKMTFSDTSYYKNIDTVFYIEDLRDHPTFTLKIRLKEKKIISYEGKLVMDYDGIRRDIQDAVIIYKDRIQRTNDQGVFCLNVEDSLKEGDSFYIIKEGYDVQQVDISSVKGFQDEYILVPADSLKEFYKRCAHIDSLHVTLNGWGYTAWEVPVRFENGQEDRIVFCGLISKEMSNDRTKCETEGYYYFMKEKKDAERKGKTYSSYHVFSGWIDKVQPGTDTNRRYEVISQDVANNKQRIIGVWNHKNPSGKRLSGRIYNNSSGIIGEFGIEEQ